MFSRAGVHAALKSKNRHGASSILAHMVQVTCIWSERDWFPVKNGKWHIYEAGAAWAGLGWAGR